MGARARGGQAKAPAPHSGESGYALMLVFLMAAVIAIALYREIPRVAFQSQRHKEQLLMERGEQYKRAIQVFYATTRRYPQNLDDLETTQRRHFLRHKYIDPMTGKSEWRIIHVQNGVLVDSVLNKNPGGQQKQGGLDGSYVAAYAGIDQSATGGTQIRPQDRRRASEGGAGGAYPGMPGAGMPPVDGTNPDGQQPAGTPLQPGMPGMPGMPGVATNLPPGVPGAPPGAMNLPPGMSGMPGMPGMPGGQPGAGSQPQGGGYVTSLPGIGATSSVQPSPAYPGQPNPNQPGGQPGQMGFPTAPGGGSNAATQMISDILTRPNPAGYQAVLRAQQLQQGGSPGMTAPGTPSLIGSTMGGGGSGMAGLASTAETDGIMVYNDRTSYNEWEFIFDPAKVSPIPPMPGGSSGGTPANRLGTTASQMNQAADSAGSGFGLGGAPGQRAPGGMPAGAAGMRMGGDFSMGGAGGAQGVGGMPGGIAGMQMGGLGMTSTGLPPNVRLGRP